MEKLELLHSNNICVVIPARGGSKTIPRKVLRQIKGRSLLDRTICTALNFASRDHVILSTDDEEIAFEAKKFGIEVVWRNNDLVADDTPLDPVIFHAVQEWLDEEKHRSVKFVITMQPTSPSLSARSVMSALSWMNKNPHLDSTVSVTEMRCLSWTIDDNGLGEPRYKARLNRQNQTAELAETGGFVISKLTNILKHDRFGAKTYPWILDFGESIDIDDHIDFALAEFLLQNNKIVIVVGGNKTIGSGHLHNMYTLAKYLGKYDITFCVPSTDELALEFLSKRNFPVNKVVDGEFLRSIVQLAPRVVINDILDTSRSYVASLQSENIHVINFEDSGSGGEIANLTVNAIYPPPRRIPDNCLFGPEYAILRPEFSAYTPKQIRPTVMKIAITYGGVDPCNLTKFVFDAIQAWCQEREINIEIIIGAGFIHYHDFESDSPNLTVHYGSISVMEVLRDVDVVFCSAGRTLIEAAKMGIPAIVIAQNEREATHWMCDHPEAVYYLGTRTMVTEKKLLNVFKKLASFENRANVRNNLNKMDFGTGLNAILSNIEAAMSTGQ